MAAEQEKRGAGRHVMQRRFVTVEDFTRGHAPTGGSRMLPAR
ncbi:hypothetical protein ACFUJ0_05805 [Streptomyces sp. NPDC057242]